MATPAYRNLLRAARIAFQGDERVLTAARQQIRTGFREKASLPAAHPSVAPSVQYANEVADFLKSNVVQGKKEGDGETYSMFCLSSFLFYFIFVSFLFIFYSSLCLLRLVWTGG